MTKPEDLQLNDIKDRIRKAECELLYNINRDLYSLSPLSPEEVAEYNRPINKFKRAIRSFYYFFKCRIIGIYEVLRYGETIGDDDYDY